MSSRTKQSAPVPFPDQTTNGCATQPPYPSACVTEAPRNERYEESNELLSEARRSVKRFLAHAAQNDMSYHLSLAAKALQALD